jgi:hypothetical protein
MAYIKITLGSGLGSGLGPNFNITANTGSVTPNTANKTQLLSGYTVEVIDSATLVTVTSVGECTTAISASFDCTTTTTSTSTSTSTTTTTTIACPNCISYVASTLSPGASGTITFMDCNGCIQSFTALSQQDRIFSALDNYPITASGAIGYAYNGEAPYDGTLGDYNLNNGCAPITDLCKTQEVTITDPGYGIFFVSYVDATDCTCKFEGVVDSITRTIISGSLATSGTNITTGSINPSGSLGSVCCPTTTTSTSTTSTTTVPPTTTSTSTTSTSTTTEPTTTTSTSTTSTSTTTTPPTTTTVPTTTTSTSTSTTTTTTLPPCVTSVGFEVEVAGEVQYTTCCGTQITEFFGIGPQVINDCLQTNSLFSLDASITDVVYGSTSCTCVTTTSTSTSTSTSTTSTTTTPPTTTTSTSTSTSTSTTSTTTEPPKFYYTGLICGGSIVGNFYSDTNLGDNPGIVYAFSATAGNTNQCFDNVSVTTTPNNNPILAIFEDCETCNNPTYYYYAVKKYDCANSCAYVSPDLLARSSTELSTTNGHYWNNGDGFVYQIQTTSESTLYDVDLDGAASNAVCSTACII